MALDGCIGIFAENVDIILGFILNIAGGASLYVTT